MSLVHRIEAVILASDEPVTLARLRDILGGGIESHAIREALAELERFYDGRGIRLERVGGGWQFRTAPEYADTVSRLWKTRPPRLSRAALETLAIIAYRQPTTRAEIEALRGVRTSSEVLAGLQERGWIKVVGRKEVPGRPHLYATGKQFLIDFGLNSLDDLPDSSQLMDEEDIRALLAERSLDTREAEAETSGDEQADTGSETSRPQSDPQKKDRQSNPSSGS